MTVNSDRYERALQGFGAVVAQADDSRWSAPSPCSEWTARHVVGHVIAVQHAIAATIAGRRAPMNPMVEPRRHAGDDPSASWQAAARSSEPRSTIPGCSIRW
jgi:uncharacterized protein (TIGR03083 family)